jgi:ribose-phosphate pyrophosphokinase
VKYGTLKVFSGSSHPAFVNAICANLGISPGQREILKFSNENIMVKILENVRGDDVFVVQTMAPPVNEHIIEALIMIDALKHASAGRITAVLPYFPYARSDKKDQPRISISARLMADLFEAAGANRFLAMNLHCSQIQGFFRIPSDQLIGGPIVVDYLKQKDLSNAVLVASDAGEIKDITHYANRLDLPIAIIDKRRYGNDEKPKARNIIGEVEGKDAYLLDDEIASGGTMLEAMDFLLKMGAASVSCGAVHGVLTGNAAEKLTRSPAREIVVCDTIPVEHKKTEKMKVLTVAPMFGQAIQRIHLGRSISELFR